MLAIMDPELVRIASELAPTVGYGGVLVEAPPARVSFFVGASLLAIMDLEPVRIASELAPTVGVWPGAAHAKQA